MKGILTVSAGDSALLKNQHNDLFFKIMSRLERDRPKVSQEGYSSVQRSERYEGESDEVVHALNEADVKNIGPYARNMPTTGRIHKNR